MRLGLALLASLFAALNPCRSELAFAETFLGIEQASGESEAPRTASVKEGKRSSLSQAAEPRVGEFDFNAGLGAGSDFVRANAAVGYSLSRYVGVETNGQFVQHKRGDAEGEEWGPNFDVILRVPNPTVATPFVAAGPGYLKWQRRYDDELFSDGEAFTGSVYGGVNLRLAPHFGIQAVRRRTEFFQTPPLSFSDRETEEPRMAIVNQIGFHVAF